MSSIKYKKLESEEDGNTIQETGNTKSKEEHAVELNTIKFIIPPSMRVENESSNCQYGKCCCVSHTMCIGFILIIFIVLLIIMLIQSGKLVINFSYN